MTSPEFLSGENKSIPPPLVDDALFRCIENSQKKCGEGLGRLLDAGTGSHSIRWIAGLIHAHPSSSDPLYISNYTAITADEQMRKNVHAEATKLYIEKRGDIVIGNWADNSNHDPESKVEEKTHFNLLEGQVYDTIIADYLVGAMDGFSPFFQDRIFPRLYNLLAPGGRLYVIGLQPIPDVAPGDANIISKVIKTRDACILLAGHRCYREYPVDWIVRHLEVAGFKVELENTFPILYSHETIARQINVARSKLKLFKNMVISSATTGATDTLTQGMEQLLDELENDSKDACERGRDGRIKLGFDYVVCAKRVDSNKS